MPPRLITLRSFIGQKAQFFPNLAGFRVNFTCPAGRKSAMPHLRHASASAMLSARRASYTTRDSIPHRSNHPRDKTRANKKHCPLSYIALLCRAKSPKFPKCCVFAGEFYMPCGVKIRYSSLAPRKSDAIPCGAVHAQRAPTTTQTRPQTHRNQPGRQQLGAQISVTFRQK